MSREEYLKACDARYEELQALGKLDNFYDFEKTFVSIWQGMGREVFEKSIGVVPGNERKKKPYNSGVDRNK